MKYPRKTALLIIDFQNDFLPGGALAVPHARDVVSNIKSLVSDYDYIILTQDWHPAGHVSFATTHGKKNFETIEVEYGTQKLWPDHCVQDTKGAEIASELSDISPDFVLRKGTRQHVDSYSAFIEADGQEITAMTQFLIARGVQHIACVGLALDYCVFWTALDAIKLGFKTNVFLNACKGIDHENSILHAIQKMKQFGVRIVE